MYYLHMANSSCSFHGVNLNVYYIIYLKQYIYINENITIHLNMRKAKDVLRI